MSDILLRLEVESDHHEVEVMTRDAFWNHFQPGADEHFLLHLMRSHADFIPELTFVAVCDDKIVGHIAYTHASIKNHESGQVIKVVLFGPLSVSPAYQGRGIGSKLVKHTENLAREMGHKAILIYGDVRFYGRLGFRSGDRYDITNENGEFCVALQVLTLQPHALDGVSGALEESELFTTLEAAMTEGFETYDAAFESREKAESKFQETFALLRSMKYKAIV